MISLELRSVESAKRSSANGSSSSAPKASNSSLAASATSMTGDFKEVTPEELKKRFGEILGALGATGALQNLEKNFRNLIDQFKGDLDKMDRMMQKKEDELGISI